MKAFQLPLKTQAKLVKATPHKEFDGKNPTKQAISLRFRARLSLALLRQFSPHAPDLFMRRREDAGQQQEVDGVPPILLEVVAPDLVLPIGFTDEFTGYTVTLDRAMGDIELYGCKVSKIRVDEPLPEGEHGTVEVEWSVGSDEKITPELVGALCAMEANDVWLGQKAPDKPAEEKAVKQARKKQEQAEAAGQQRLDVIDGSVGHPGAARAAAMEAGDAFSAAQHGGQGGPHDEQGQGEDDGSGHTDVDGAPGTGSSDDQLGQNWPFPRDGAEGAAGETEAGTGETPAQETATAPRARRGRKAAAQVE